MLLQCILRCLSFSESSSPTVFLQCGSWIFPLVPGRSPVLKTEDRTFMIPDINLDTGQAETSQLGEGKFPTVGLVFSPDMCEDKIKRFERILKCYSDYRYYTPEYSEDSDRAEPSTSKPQETSLALPETRTSQVPVSDETVVPASEEDQVCY